MVVKTRGVNVFCSISKIMMMMIIVIIIIIIIITIIIIIIIINLYSILIKKDLCAVLHLKIIKTNIC